MEKTPEEIIRKHCDRLEGFAWVLKSRKRGMFLHWIADIRAQVNEIEERDEILEEDEDAKL